MKPINFEGFNCTYAENQPEYLPLPAMRFPDGTVISCWELTDEEVAQLINSKRIYISMLTFNQPLQPLRPAVELTELVEIRNTTTDRLEKLAESLKKNLQGPTSDENENKVHRYSIED